MKNLMRKSGTLKFLIVLLALVLAAGLVACDILAGDPADTNKPTDGATQPPKLTVELLGDAEVTLEFGEEFTDPGAQAFLDGKLCDLTVHADSKVDETKLGTYVVTYKAVSGDQTAEVQRTVTIVDTQAPVITLQTVEGHITYPGQPYVEEGFTAMDNYDGDITVQVTSVEENGVVTYTVSDSSGNTATIQRTLTYCDVSEPQLMLKGETEITITAGTKFQEPGYSASDFVDGDLTDAVQIKGSVNIYMPGTYTLTYTVTNGQMNSVSKTRTVTVEGLVQPEVVDPGDKIIYLTFDDGPCKHTLKLLEVLEKYNVKATFFIVGSMSVGYLDEIAAGGHSLGMHSMEHEYKDIYSSEEAFFKDLYACQKLIYDRTGVLTTLLRFPGGSSNTVSRKYSQGIMSKLVVEVEAQGFQYFDWNVSSNDAGGTKTAEGVFNNVINGVQKHNISVVLQHDIKKYSVEAVEQIIQWGLANGYTFLPLDPTSPECHSKVNN